MERNLTVLDRRLVVLVIESESGIRRAISKALRRDGVQVHETDSLRRGLSLNRTLLPDVIVLALTHADAHGLSDLQDLRALSDAHVLVLSDQASEQHLIDALDAGADAYLTKPVSFTELAARVRVLRRRRLLGVASGGFQKQTVEGFGDVRVNVAERLVTRGGAPVKLTPTEFRLLVLMLGNAGQVLTHVYLLKGVWGPGHADDRQYLRVYMRGLRQKLEVTATSPRHLMSESSIGYRLVI